jgi:hypothetical protein
MENLQADLFETGININQRMKSVSSPEPAYDRRKDKVSDQPVLTGIDQNMIDIVSTYIQRIPDNNTKKHFARSMINFIIKSANL